MRQRGFNQSALLAREMGALLGVPVLDALQRRGSGIPQVELGLANRRLNVVDAFAARADAPLHGRVVILVDDVVTTGSTIGACARALVAAGAAEVRCASLARRVGAMP
jgi:predicted amidophosphoribosyltransferase